MTISTFDFEAHGAADKNLDRKLQKKNEANVLCVVDTISVRSNVTKKKSEKYDQLTLVKGKEIILPKSF